MVQQRPLQWAPLRIPNSERDNPRKPRPRTVCRQERDCSGPTSDPAEAATAQPIRVRQSSSGALGAEAASEQVLRRCRRLPRGHFFLQRPERNPACLGGFVRGFHLLGQRTSMETSKLELVSHFFRQQVALMSHEHLTSCRMGKGHLHSTLIRNI